MIGGLDAVFGQGSIGQIYHYVSFPRFAGDRLKTACGKELPESHALFWGSDAKRCEDCIVMKKKDPK